jgi:hypothetical protein
MILSRWKLLTGVLGLSIGGFAAFGGQPSRPEVLVVADNKPTMPPAAPAPTDVALPVVPVIPTTSPAPVKEETKPSTKPAVEAPALPLPDPKPLETKLPPTTPARPMEVPVVLPASGTIPPAVAPSALSSLPDTPAVAPMPPPTLLLPATGKPTAAAELPTTPPVAEIAPPKATPVAPTPVAAAVPTKFRIVLRVGSGEPSFEVRHDDDLVMKVVCEKVDIKSPEKGQGPSNVTATGKVRFVGFGAEGSCDTLSFLAGTGEVSLAGNVNVKVKDKIGRVESELNADKMQYKLDQTALTGVLKP